jgi:hypothetical protein
MIVVKLQGGLGNQMFQYALGRELQRRNGGELYLDLTWLLDRYPRTGVVYRDYELDIFGIQPRFTPLSEIARLWSVPLVLMYGSVYLSRLRDRVGLRRLVQESSSSLSPEELLELKGDLYLDGHWTSQKYFEGSESILRKEFRVREPLLPISESVGASIAETDSICLNVRRTDYVTLKASIDMHGFVGKEYYDRGISLLAPQLENPHIFITSDDVEWCRANLRFDYPTTILGDEHQGYKFGNKFALMSRCRHFLIPNSTFAWWAAWLGSSPDKIVICPRKWFRDPNIDASDMIPRGWIRL